MRLSKWVLGFAALALVIPPGFAKADADLSAAKSYLLANANSPWATMALSALSAPSIPEDHLKNVSGSAIDYAAPVLAITSLGKDPRTFSSEDYIAKLKSFNQNSQLGDSSTVNDDIFGLLALISAGEGSSEAAANAKNFILTNQNTDGGWGFATGGTSDSNMTSTAIVALIASGLGSTDTHIAKGFDYLKTAQNTDGGFIYDPKSSFGTGSDSSSTAWALWAIKSAGQDASSWSKEGKTPTDYLNGQQTSSGWFRYQDNTSADAFTATTTAYASIALAGKTLPLQVVPAPNPGGGGNGGGGTQTKPYSFRIEGSTSTICEGQTDAPNPLELVKQASSTCGFTYHIKQTGFGPYLDQIGDDLASGTKGWMYFVNYESPPVGANDYPLKTGDSVLWYFGDFDWLPTRLTVESTSLSSGQEIKAKVEFYKNSVWSALPAATVYAGTVQSATNDTGNASLTASDGYFKVFAEKSGYIRSNGIGVKVGTSGNSEVSLKVNVTSGQVLGDSIGIMVSTSSADFGTLSKGQTGERKVTVFNTGGGPVVIETQVSGDSLFVDKLTVNDSAWQSFKTSLFTGASKEATLKLNVPSSYSSTGSKNGKLIFWAASQ